LSDAADFFRGEAPFDADRLPVRDDFVAGFRAITLSPYNIDRRLSPSRQVGEKANSDKCGNGKRRVISGKKT
jgi:hypothetical protein